jgi:hypothetical protein
MLAVTLTFSTLISLMFLMVGCMIGWAAKQYLYEKNYVAYTHPEMFDQNGHIIPDEILAVRFENTYDDDDEEEIDHED